MSFHSAALVALLGVSATEYAHDAHAELSCTAMMDARAGKLLMQEGSCDKRVTPASTFKIAISLMAYDAGILKDEHTPALPFHEGYIDWNPAWRTSTDPTSWIKNSVVWYSQQVTTQLGEEKFQRYANQFHYGNQDVSGEPGKHNGLTYAWLDTSLAISPLEQVTFLTALTRRQLGVSEHAYQMTEKLTKIRVLENGWEIHGKTGTGFPRKLDGAEDYDHAYGWFVGWATKGEQTIAFARLIQDDKRGKVNAGLRVRDAFMDALPLLLEKN